MSMCSKPELPIVELFVKAAMARVLDYNNVQLRIIKESPILDETDIFYLGSEYLDDIAKELGAIISPSYRQLNFRNMLRIFEILNKYFEIR